MTGGVKRKAVRPLEVGRHVKSVIARIALLAEQGDRTEALRLAQALHADYPNRADANDSLALALLDVERPGEAMKFAQRAVELEPASVAYSVNLGLLYLDAGLAEDALPLLDRAAQNRSCPAQAPWALARYFSEIGRADQSFPYFEKAIATADAADVPLIQLDYLRGLTTAGRVEQAMEVARLLKQNRMMCDQATVLEAGLTQLPPNSPILDELRKIADSETTDSSVRSHAMLQIGRVQDRAGNYPQAFASFEQAKSLRNVNFDLKSFEHYVEGLIQTYDAEMFRQYGAIGNKSDVPVFVVGMPRSGTTLTEQILAAHPDAAGIGEQMRITSLARRLSPENDPARIRLALQNAKGESWSEAGEAYLRLARHLQPDAKRIVDKMPHNFLFVGFIALVLPNARIVHVHRNPLDNFLSAFENNFSEFHSYSFNQESYGQYYLLYQRLMQHWMKVLPGKVLDWDYEQLVNEPEARMRKLLEFVDLPWSDECLNFHEKTTTVKTFSLHQVRKPISNKSVGRWKNYAAELQPIRRILGL